MASLRQVYAINSGPFLTVPLSLTLRIGEVDVEEEILDVLDVEEVPPPSPQMSRPELTKLSETQVGLHECMC